MIRNILTSLLAVTCFALFGCADNCNSMTGDDAYYCDEDDITEEEAEFVIGAVVLFFDALDGEIGQESDDPCSGYTAPYRCKSFSEAFSIIKLRIGSPTGIMPVQVTFYSGTPALKRVLNIYENPIKDLTVRTTKRAVFAEAVYVINGVPITIVEGTRLRVSPKSEKCGIKCYVAENATLDLFWTGTGSVLK